MTQCFQCGQTHLCHLTIHCNWPTKLKKVTLLTAVRNVKRAQRGYAAKTAIIFLNSLVWPVCKFAFHVNKNVMCWFLGLKLEGVKELSMHRYGATAGCPDSCRSQGSFLIISTLLMRPRTAAPAHYSHTYAGLTVCLRKYTLHFWATMRRHQHYGAHAELLLFN